MCTGAGVPMMPYFNSNLDQVAWRWGVPGTGLSGSVDTSYVRSRLHARRQHVGQHLRLVALEALRVLQETRLFPVFDRLLSLRNGHEDSEQNLSGRLDRGGTLR